MVCVATTSLLHSPRPYTRIAAASSPPDTNAYYAEHDVRYCVYASAEFLLGRYFQNALISMGLEDNYKVCERLAHANGSGSIPSPLPSLTICSLLPAHSALCMTSAWT